MKQEITPEEITAKMAAGLTRAQAIEVLTTQAEHDAALAVAETPTEDKPDKPAKPKK